MNCHSEPFACHSELREESLPSAQDKLREESHKFLRYAQDKLRLTPQNDITTQSLTGEGGGEGEMNYFLSKNLFFGLFLICYIIYYEEKDDPMGEGRDC
jgi:hypothetical protein